MGVSDPHPFTVPIVSLRNLSGVFKLHVAQTLEKLVPILLFSASAIYTVGPKSSFLLQPFRNGGWLCNICYHLLKSVFYMHAWVNSSGELTLKMSNPSAHPGGLTA
ncbi:conserved hypothetical protein [Ricinus communis]|uniref:Uncharacterized protein n=1 Tax=Ricinus communis TaxID=3988 RepID=B9RB65_RICCO|nr:conserved hypothetical protein [Ricinus communis]